jgi:hypothetical protein
LANDSVTVHLRFLFNETSINVDVKIIVSKSTAGKSSKFAIQLDCWMMLPGEKFPPQEQTSIIMFINEVKAM